MKIAPFASENLEDGDQCKVLYSCEHMYHQFCIDEWLARNPHCPLCRSSVRGSGSSCQPHEGHNQLLYLLVLTMVINIYTKTIQYF